MFNLVYVEDGQQRNQRVGPCSTVRCIVGRYGSRGRMHSCPSIGIESKMHMVQMGDY